MAKIKGITIEIDGKTTGLDKALASVNKSAGNLQKELKGVNTLLKMDPTNTTLLAQKQEILNQSVSKTSEKLKQLKDAQEQVNESFAKGDISEENYRNFQREIVATENKLKDLTNEQKQFATSAKRLDGVADKFDKIGNSADKAGRKLSGVSKGAGAVVAGATAAMFATEEFSTDLSKMNINAQEAGVGLGVTEKAFKAFAVATDEVDSSVEATSNLLQAGFTESNLQQAVEGLTGAYLKFPDTLKIEGLADSLQETLATGKSMGMFGEMLDRVGIGADNFNKRLAECSTTAEKQNLILNTLESEGLNGTYEAWTKQNKALKDQKEVQLQAQLALSKFGMTISSVVMPALLPLVEKLTALAEKFANLSMGQKKAIVGFTLLLAGLAPTLIVIGKMATGLGALTRGLGAVAPALKGLKALFMGLSFNPFVLVVAGVTALLLALGLANSGSDETKEKLSGIATTVGQMFRQLPNIIMTGFNSLLARLPELAQMGIRMIDYLLNGLIQAMPKITAQLPVIITTIVTGITTLLPKIIDIGINLIVALANGLVTAIPTIIASIPVIIKALVEGILTLLPELIKTGVKLIKALWSGFKSWVATFITNVVAFAKSIPEKIKTGLGNLISIGLNFIKTLWNGFKSWVSTFVSNVVGFAKGIPTSIKNGLGSLFDIGANLIKGLWNGISSVTDWIIEKIGGFTDSVLSAIKGFFGIESPSKYTAEDGKFLVMGLAKGMVDNTKHAIGAVKEVCGQVGTSMKDGMSTVLDKALDDSTKVSTAQARTMADNLTDKMLDNMLKNVRNAVTKMKEELGSVKGEQDNFAMLTGSGAISRSMNVNQTVNVVNPKGTPADIAREVRNKANMQLLGVL